MTELHQPCNGVGDGDYHVTWANILRIHGKPAAGPDTGRSTADGGNADPRRARVDPNGVDSGQSAGWHKHDHTNVPSADTRGGAG